MVSIKSIKIERESIIDLKTDLLVLAQEEDGNVTHLDSDLNSSIDSVASLESFKGKNGKSIHLYGNGNTKRVSIFGLGKKEKLNSDSIRSLASKVSTYASKLNLSSFSVDGSSFGLDDSEYAQAFAEGLVLGNYQFLD